MEGYFSTRRFDTTSNDDHHDHSGGGGGGGSSSSTAALVVVGSGEQGQQEHFVEPAVLLERTFNKRTNKQTKNRTNEAFPSSLL